MAKQLFTILTVFFWVLFFYAFHKDRSRYRNCVLLFIALCSTIECALLWAGDDAFRIAFPVIGFILLLVPFFLIWNGIITIHKEGFRLSHMLSLALGLIIAFGEASLLFVVMDLSGQVASEWFPAIPVSTFALLTGISIFYLSLSFLMFMIYSLFLMIIPHKRDFDYVIIHGAGLLRGIGLTKLLSQRVDKAIQVYRHDPTPPKIIPSGGQGKDERISEAQAMTTYLLKKGIPASQILAEDHSHTTLENLANSKAIIDARPGRKYTALVTSNYHVFRALRYCRKIGLKCTGIGSPVALYYWPSALIREYIAIHAEKKHLLTLLLGWLATLGLTYGLYLLY